MISNRQNRRRGRGGQRNQPGNARDNRQRGNAAQLLEKYKGLARDAQMSGDRVQAEYYLQFADHYFRVLEDHRSQKDDQQPDRQKARQQDDQDEQPPRPKKAEANVGEEKPKRVRRTEGEPKPRKSKANGSRPDADEGGNGIAADALPPAIGDDDAKDAKPKRARRRPSDDGETAAA